MSHAHTPPVPKDNQSPYPLHEPPHPQAGAKSADKSAPHAGRAKDDHTRALAIGAAVGIGAAALALAAGVFLLEERAKPKKGKKPAGHKARPKPAPKPKKPKPVNKAGAA